MTKRTQLLSLVSLVALSACSHIPPQAYYNRGDPENLLDLSSEVVNMSVGSPGALSELSQMIANDPPTHAELNCSPSSAPCSQARNILMKHNIPVQPGQGGSGVTLVYERIVARDCENRYIDNSINPYNLNHPTFGCSVTGNTVQMVSDRRQFVDPNLLDFPDAEKSVQNYRSYLKPGQKNGSLKSSVSSSGSQ